jgi:uncharacterized SAM-binding protein YcdF (DUF218 family)
LEALYPALDPRAPVPQVSYVVVLGSDYTPDESLPATATIGRDALVRVVEGIRLARQLPEARLILSGGSVFPGREPARGYERLAVTLGMDAHAIIVMDRAVDTAGEARDIAMFLGSKPFLLVTAASHMPRAMRLLRDIGARPIPAPTAHITRRDDRFQWGDFFPRTSAIRTTEMALHEYVGLSAVAFGLGRPAASGRE